MPSRGNEDVTRWVRAWIIRQMATGLKDRHLAKTLGVSHPTVIGVRTGTKTVGQDVETKIAERLTGGSVDTLRKAARDGAVDAQVVIDRDIAETAAKVAREAAAKNTVRRTPELASLETALDRYVEAAVVLVEPTFHDRFRLACVAAKIPVDDMPEPEKLAAYDDLQSFDHERLTAHMRTWYAGQKGKSAEHRSKPPPGAGIAAKRKPIRRS